MAKSQKKLAEIDHKSKEVTKKIIREVLGKSLSEIDHEKLIMSALVKAKSDEIL